MATILRSVFEVLLVAQATQATIAGTVRDEQTSDPIAGVVVALPDLFRSAVTGPDGRYVLTDVPAGPQHLTIEQIGYAGRTLHALVPREGLLEVNVALQPRPIPLPTVVVRPRIALRGVEPGEQPERRVSMAAVSNHPLLAEPDPFRALGGGVVVMLPEMPGGLHIRGGASDQTAWLLDGIPVFSPYHAAGLFSAWNADALAGIELHAAAPSPALPAALSGVVSAATRPAGARVGVRGALTTTQASLTMDGPVGTGGAGWLLSVRSGFPGALSPGESSYVRGETSDWLAKIEAPLLGGTLAVLGYENENELDAAASADSPAAPPGAPEPAAGTLTGSLPDGTRNRFGWHSRSMGATWTGRAGANAIRLSAWSASSEATALWRLAAEASAHLNAARRDEGALLAVERIGSGTTTAGVRLRRSGTSYAVRSGDSGDATHDVTVTTPVTSLFVEHERPIGSHVTLELGAAATAAAGGLHTAPRARVSWYPMAGLVLRASVARLQQFEQSLRNPESVVGSIFPVDLFVGSGSGAAPVARGDQAVLSAEFRSSGWRIGAQGFTRSFHGLVLVAPVDGEPFSTESFATGSGDAKGFAVDASVSGARFGALAGWGWRQVRRVHDALDYVPEHAVAHDIEAGVVLFPTPTSSIRLGATGLLGRRTTPVPGGLEWESCNLLDRGCEFAGSPHYGDVPPGSAVLPAYVRLDLGLRKHWHIRAMGRDAILGLSGTITNVIGRGNTLTWSTDPATGERAGIDMRPRAPLVIGLDWRF